MHGSAWHQSRWLSQSLTRKMTQGATESDELKVFSLKERAGGRSAECQQNPGQIFCMKYL